MQPTLTKTPTQIISTSLIADIILAGMLVGPVVAPYLAASSLPILPIIAHIIYFMGNHVCPQPDMGVMLASPWIMAVCMRCYGTVMGLFLTRLLWGQNKGKAFYWLHQYGWSGATLATTLMMAYGFELAIQVLGWWNFNNWLVTPFGFITGIGWGLFMMPFLHSQSGDRYAPTRKPFEGKASNLDINKYPSVRLLLTEVKK